MKILLAYDGSPGAEAALDDMQRAGLPTVAEALVLSVADVFLPPLPDEEPVFAEQPPAQVQRVRAHALQAVEAMRAVALQGRERVQERFRNWQVRADARADSPAWAVIQEADIWQPDLIVVGSHGRSALGRLVLGSVSHKIVTEVHGSVRVARGHAKTPDMPVRMLVGVDGSAGAAAAIHAMAGRIWPSGSEMRLVTALDDRMMTAAADTRQPEATWWQDGAADVQVWVPKMVEALSEPLRRAGLTVSSVIKEGDAKHLLVEEAEHWEADGICVGARGLRGIERFLLGSVSATIVTRAPCSVEVIHAPRAAAGDRKE